MTEQNEEWEVLQDKIGKAKRYCYLPETESYNDAVIQLVQGEEIPKCGICEEL